MSFSRNYNVGAHLAPGLGHRTHLTDELSTKVFRVATRRLLPANKFTTEQIESGGLSNKNG